MSYRHTLNLLGPLLPVPLRVTFWPTPRVVFLWESSALPPPLPSLAPL